MIGMPLLLDSTLKVSVIVLLALGVTTLLLRQQQAALRHWVLAWTIACAAGTPTLSLVVPAWQVRVSSPSFRPASSQSNLVSRQDRFEGSDPVPDVQGIPGMDAATPAAQTTPLTGLLTTIWTVAAAVSLGVLLVGLVRLVWLASRARRVEAGPWRRLADQISRDYALRRPVVLLHTDHPSLLVTWGLRRPKVLLPAPALGWSADRIRIVLRHELAHVQRGDWVVQMSGEALKSIYWFNPLVWIVVRRLRLESEQACDDAVMNGGIDGSEYATHLVELARTLNQGHRTWVPAPAIARQSSLQRRVSAMLNAGLNRRPLARSARIATAIALLAVTIPIAAAQAAFATLSGSVLDQSGGIIPKATLALVNLQSQAKYEVRSNEAGHFEFVGLPAGEYQLEARFIGFAVYRETLTLSAGQILPKNIGLQLGTLQETINVIDGDVPRRAASLRARPAAKGPCTRAAVGGRIVPPAKLTDVRPQYPPNLRSARADGRVEMEGKIGTDGSFRELRVVSSPHADMASAALEAVRQWEFSPTLLNCVPVEVDINVAVNFRPQQ